jgi:N-acyl-D-amino-acid deacylase
MAEFDTIIKGGTIVDGTRVPRYKGDIGIKNGKIAKIGRLTSSDATKVVDASGLVVAPGFIDLHTHYDAQLHWDPYCSIGSWHGVTSVTIGNCGFGFAPIATTRRGSRHVGVVPHRGDSAGTDASVDESRLGNLPAIHGTALAHALGD